MIQKKKKEINNIYIYIDRQIDRQIDNKIEIYYVYFIIIFIYHYVKTLTSQNKKSLRH